MKGLKGFFITSKDIRDEYKESLGKSMWCDINSQFQCVIKCFMSCTSSYRRKCAVFKKKVDSSVHTLKMSDILKFDSPCMATYGGIDIDEKEKKEEKIEKKVFRIRLIRQRTRIEKKLHTI